jgi:putative flippase GtrA
MYKLFARYASVGVVNTAVHWAVFFSVHAAGVNQAFSNMSAFFVAVTFSFFANAKFTFNGKATTGRYLIYLGFMGAMAASVGQMSDSLGLPSIFTLITFSAVSLVMGFFYSKYIVFRDEK